MGQGATRERKRERERERKIGKGNAVTRCRPDASVVPREESSVVDGVQKQSLGK